MNLWYKGALELAAAIRDREISAVETLDLYLDRIDHFNPEHESRITHHSSRTRLPFGLTPINLGGSS